MPPLLRAVYERLRDEGAYDTDWIDRAAWWALAAFLVVLFLF